MKKFVILMYCIVSELYTRMIAECHRFNGRYHSPNITSIIVMKSIVKMFGDQTGNIHSLKHGRLAFTSCDDMKL